MGKSDPTEGTVHIDIVWSNRWKRYDITTTEWRGRHPITRTLKMEHPHRIELDGPGLRAIVQAIIREYQSWIF